MELTSVHAPGWPNDPSAQKLAPHPDDAEPDLVEEFLAERPGVSDVPFDDPDRG